MKTSEILKIAKMYLWDGRNHQCGALGLCGAIKRAIHNNRNSTDRVKASEVIDRVQSSLGKWVFVSSWLRAEHNIPAKKLTPKNLQAYRQLWLNELIAEYESKGD